MGKKRRDWPTIAIYNRKYNRKNHCMHYGVGGTDVFSRNVSSTDSEKRFCSHTHCASLEALQPSSRRPSMHRQSKDERASNVRVIAIAKVSQLRPMAKHWQRCEGLARLSLHALELLVRCSKYTRIWRYVDARYVSASKLLVHIKTREIEERGKAGRLNGRGNPVCYPALGNGDGGGLTRRVRNGIAQVPLAARKERRQ